MYVQELGLISRDEGGAEVVGFSLPLRFPPSQSRFGNYILYVNGRVLTQGGGGFDVGRMSRCLAYIFTCLNWTGLGHNIVRHTGVQP